MKSTFAVLLLTFLVLVHGTNGDCESETQTLSNSTELYLAELAVLNAVDMTTCQQGNRENTRQVCGADYAEDAPQEYADFQAICADLGGQFQTINSGIYCKHPDSDFVIDHDVLNQPDCVGISCSEGYAQSVHENEFFRAYKEPLEADGSECELTSGAVSLRNLVGSILGLIIFQAAV